MDSKILPSAGIESLAGFCDKVRELLASNQLPEEKAVEIKMRLSEDLQDYHYYQSLIDLVHSVTTTPGETGKIQNELFY